jgi:hypothetical protein
MVWTFYNIEQPLAESLLRFRKLPVMRVEVKRAYVQIFVSNIQRWTIYSYLSIKIHNVLNNVLPYQ